MRGKTPACLQALKKGTNHGKRIVWTYFPPQNANTGNAVLKYHKLDTKGEKNEKVQIIVETERAVYMNSSDRVRNTLEDIELFKG